jgi:UDP-N-acetylmuramyl pentapeptide phosphotransferase/UDP-N-acetylglucosamine-1-phosphate transferase
VLLTLGVRSWGDSGEGISLFLLGLGGLIVAESGFWDDVSRLAPGWKFLFQLLGCGLVLLGGVWLSGIAWPWGRSWSLGWFAVPVTLFWITGMTNLYNFMDGVDGIAGGVGTLYGLGVAWAAFHTGHPAEGAVALAIAAGCLGFLWFNFPPAKIFMGDVGSLLLGFLFAVLAVRLSQGPSETIPFCFFAILYSSFEFDATYTLVRRGLKGEKVWEPHRSHLYQRLVIAGWSHLRVTLLYMALSALSLALAMLYLRSGWTLRCLCAIIQLAVCFGLVVLVKVIEGNLRRNPGKP